MENNDKGEKFLFDRDFDDMEILREIVEQEELERENQSAGEDGEIDPEDPPEPEEEIPTFTEEDVEAARKQGYDAGHQQGLIEAEASINQQIAKTLGVLEDRISDLFVQQAEAIGELNRETAKLAASMVRKLFPSLSSAHAEAEVAAMVDDMMKSLVQEPKVSIWVHPDLEEGIRTRCETIAKENSIAGEVQVSGDLALGIGDCRLEWFGGSAERDADELMNSIEGAVRHQTGDQEAAAVEAEPQKESKKAAASEPQEPTDNLTDDDAVGISDTTGATEDTDAADDAGEAGDGADDTDSAENKEI